MVDGDQYRRRGAALARRIKAPELPLLCLCLGLAARSDRLARSRERANAHATGDPTATGLPDSGTASADSPDAERPDAERPGTGTRAGPLSDTASRAG